MYVVDQRSRTEGNKPKNTYQDRAAPAVIQRRSVHWRAGVLIAACHRLLPFPSIRRIVIDLEKQIIFNFFKSFFYLFYPKGKEAKNILTH